MKRYAKAVIVGNNVKVKPVLYDPPFPATYEIKVRGIPRSRWPVNSWIAAVKIAKVIDKLPNIDQDTVSKIWKSFEAESERRRPSTEDELWDAFVGGSEHYECIEWYYTRSGVRPGKYIPGDGRVVVYFLDSEKKQIFGIHHDLHSDDPLLKEMWREWRKATGK